MIVLDTNVISELARDHPEPRVVGWVDEQDSAELVISVVTAAEVRAGVALLPAGRRRQRIHRVMETLVTETFAGYLLPFDGEASREYAEVLVRRRRAGNPISALDAVQAAICRQHDAVLATRNVDDFAHTGVDIVNPWN